MGKDSAEEQPGESAALAVHPDMFLTSSRFGRLGLVGLERVCAVQ